LADQTKGIRLSNGAQGSCNRIPTRSLDVTWLIFADLCGAAMQDEAEISISGVKLTHEESMTVRVAIDTLANVLAEGLEENETKALTDLYLTSLSRIQRLLESREPRKQ
jgi:hypothetical protein